MTLDAGGWVIGDNLIADIAGGRAAGLRTIWIDRGAWPDQEHDADPCCYRRAPGDGDLAQCALMEGLRHRSRQLLYSSAVQQRRTATAPYVITLHRPAPTAPAGLQGLNQEPALPS
ncbi:HAD hydrolase-like protein [Microbispora triticiradicis]|nr:MULTISPECIES: HAD hydrolase-like protein [Microbispora]